MKYVFAGFLLLSSSGCNFNQKISLRGLDLHTHEAGGATYVNMEAIVSVGNLKLPNTNSPIKIRDQVIGEVSIEPLEDGSSRVAFTINENEARKFDDEGLGLTLPNGRKIPSVLKNDDDLTGISVLQNSRVYVGGDLNDRFYGGIALNIAAFDHIFSPIPSALNLFHSYPFSKELFGLAGVYTSPRAELNGLGIFARKSLGTSRTLASVAETPDQEDFQQLDQITLLRLNDLVGKRRTLRIK